MASAERGLWVVVLRLSRSPSRERRVRFPWRPGQSPPSSAGEHIVPHSLPAGALQQPPQTTHNDASGGDTTGASAFLARGSEGKSLGHLIATRNSIAWSVPGVCDPTMCFARRAVAPCALILSGDLLSIYILLNVECKPGSEPWIPR